MLPSDLPAPVPSTGSQLRFGVLWHPDVRRIGACAQVPIRSGGAIDLSRESPIFDDGRPLDDPHVSRSPLQLVPQPGGGVQLWPGRAGLAYAVEGRLGRGGEWLPLEWLVRGARLRLGDGPLLHLLHVGGPEEPRALWDRPVDAARLAVEALRARLLARGREARLAPESRWLGVDVIEALLAGAWVRDERSLAEVCARLAEAWADAPACQPPEAQR